MKKLNSMTDDRSVPVVIHVAKQLAELLELPQDAKRILHLIDHFC
jgi:hypothetical protein